jgi:uncharacterized protein YhaN
MRLRRLDLTRYGHFTDASLDFGPAPDDGPDLHLVYGPNEAGKSTSMSAILDLLFGMRAQKHPYAFLHEVKTLAIGGALEIGGTTHELRRVRGATSLRDARGDAADEGIIAQGVGGMDRAAFEGLYALDDDTLERGGDEILASRGDLGQLLFSASAGLSDLSVRLTALRATLDAFDRPGARKTELRELGREEADLRAKIKAADTPAPEHARLRRIAKAAGAAHAAAVAARAAARTDAMRAAARAAALPALGRLRTLRADLAAAGPGPDAPAGWAGEVAQLRERAAALGADLANARAALARLDAETPPAPDAPALAAGGALERLGGPEGRYTAAGSDLPTRRADLAASARDIDARCADLGAPAEALHLSPAQELEAKALIAARSGIDARVKTARAERDAAARHLASLDMPPEGPADAAGTARLRGAAQALDRSDHAKRAVAASDALAQAQAEWAATLPSLAPWRGDPADLAATAPPGTAQIAAWRDTLATLGGDLATRADALARMAAQAETARTALALRQSRAEGLTDADADAARTARTDAWAALRAAWSDPGATAFERAMDADDAITRARLAAADRLADLRAAQEGALHAAGALAEAAAHHGAAAARHDALRGAIAAAAADLGAGSAEDAAATLPALIDWIAARDRALAALYARRAAETALKSAHSDGAALREAVLAALGEAAATPRGAAPRTDADLARAATAAADAAQDASHAAAAARTAAKAGADALAAREAALAEADADDGAWTARHGALVATTPWIAPAGVPPAAGMEAALAGLAGLTPLVARRRDTAHRIDAMERDRTAYVDAIAKLADEMADSAGAEAARADPLAVADRLRARLRAARDRETARAKHRALREDAAAALEALSAEETRLAARRAAITAHFAVATLAEAADALATAETRARLTRELAAAQSELTSALGAATAPEAEAMLDGVDAEALRGDRATAEAAESVAEGSANGRRDELRAAQTALAAIGVDDGAALLVQAHTALLEDIAVRARAHLSRRLGLMAAERALKIQRDTLRSGMLNGASAAFAAITGGAYPSLRVEPGENGAETLLAQTRDGPVREAHELSKGTRFQLYLALRLAGRAELARRRSPAPLLLDDILETFDEDRSAETFHLLGEAARHGQAIYFTHHRHLCAIAQTACPGVRIHYLQDI